MHEKAPLTVKAGKFAMSVRPKQTKQSEHQHKQKFINNQFLAFSFCKNNYCSGGSATSVDDNGVSGYYGGASGGSIWITCQTVKIGGKSMFGGFRKIF